jgi:hypothetical protein
MVGGGGSAHVAYRNRNKMHIILQDRYHLYPRSNARIFVGQE